MNKSLGHEKYKYAAVATDVVIFTVVRGELKVLLIKMKKKPYTNKWALPGGLVHAEESVDDAAKRILEEKTGVSKVYLKQLAAFGRVGRDPFGRVVSVAYFALVSSDKLKLKTTEEYSDVAWFDVKKVTDLAYDHDEILRTAVSQLKGELMYSKISAGLLPTEFTLTDLQHLYEVILNRNIDKRNFRKKIQQSGLIKAVGKQRKGTASRPAALFKFI